MTQDTVELFSRAIIDAQSCGSAGKCPFCGAYNLSGFEEIEDNTSRYYQPHDDNCVVLKAQVVLGNLKSVRSKYTFAIDPSGDEVVVCAENEASAHLKAWEALTRAQKDATACLDLVDVQEID